jgi:hypothetical protein
LYAFRYQDKRTSKKLFQNGKMESEGWLNKSKKVDYWFYNYENSNKKEEAEA